MRFGRNPIGPLALALALWLAAGTPTARAHGEFPDYVAGSLRFEDGALRGSLLFLPSIFELWTGLRREKADALPAAEIEPIHQAAIPLLGEVFLVEVDGVRVRPVVGAPLLRRVLHNERPWAYLEFPIEYPLKAAPRRVSFVWSRWDAFQYLPLDLVVLELHDALKAHSLYFEPTEPEQTWLEPRPPRAPVAVAGSRPPPLLSLDPPVRLARLSLALSALAALLAWIRRARRGVAYAAIALGLASSSGAAAWALQRGQLPAGPPRPPDAEARALFEALQLNIYRAFDYQRESDIYDALAQSVGGPLLDQIYVDVYQGLVMADAGGARGRVSRVVVSEAHIEPPADPTSTRIAVRARWTVFGSVAHWGHEHRREVEHHARFVLDHREEGWRITSVEQTEPPRVVRRIQVGGGQPPQPR